MSSETFEKYYHQFLIRTIRVYTYHISSSNEIIFSENEIPVDISILRCLLMLSIGPNSECKCVRIGKIKIFSPERKKKGHYTNKNINVQ